MSEPENVSINPFEKTGWWYEEFLATGGQKATPTTGIDAAQTWLDANITPAAGAVFGNVDSGGTVRLFWYGTKFTEVVEHP
jgi:hypothetical protein